MNGQLVLLRHGQSTANAAGTFTGLLDVPLTRRGEDEAATAATLLATAAIRPTLILTSTLQRATHTAEIVRTALGCAVPIRRMWQLNERNYGALTGMGKAQAREQYGAAAFTAMRRSVHGTPPPMREPLWRSLRDAAARSGVPPAAVQRTESLSDVIRRVHPVLQHHIRKAAAEGATVLVVAHGNSLRALMVHIDALTDTDVEALNLPTGQPLRYRWSTQHGWTPRHGTYLDPTAVDAAAAVAAEGGT